jgi:hypothetical protein
MRRHRVIGRRDGPLRVADQEPACSEAAERLRARDLMDEVEIDGEDSGRARLLDDDMLVPDLLE